MAAVSYLLSTQTLEDYEMNDTEITIGTAAPTSAGLEVRVTVTSTGAFQNNKQIIRALQKVIRRIENGEVGGSNDTGLI